MGVKKGKKIASEALQGVARHTGDLIHPAQEVIEEGVEAAAKRGTKAMGKHGDDVAKAASKKGDDAIRSATKKGVTTGDFGTYREMGKRALPRDGLQHDHIPSSAAVKKAYRDQQSPRRITSTELDKVHANAPSMAVPNEWHTD